MRRLLAAVIFVVTMTYSLSATSFSVCQRGHQADVTEFRDVAYVCLEGNGRTRVSVSCDETIESCSLSPLDAGVSVNLKDGVASFTLPMNGWWMLRVNGTKRLFIFYEKKERTPKGMLATDFPDLQTAFDAASGSGRTLIVPAGEYLSGTLRIGSNSDIYLSKGATIRATDDRNDFPTDDDRLEADKVNHPESYSDNGERMTFSRMILIEGENVRLRGRGTIDGNGTVLRAQGKPANLLRVRNSRNVTIEGVILRNPAAWNTHILGSENVTVKGVKIINDPLVPNTDGIDPDSSVHVLVENCFAYCSDDNIAIKSSNNSDILRDVDNIVVRNCVFLTRKSSLKVGTETKARRMGNILFDGNKVLECDRAFALYCNDGAEFHDIVYRNNVVEKSWPDSQRKAIHFKISERSGKGRIHDVTIEGCKVLDSFQNESEIRGLDPEHTIDNVTIVNCKGLDGVIKQKHTRNTVVK